MYLQRKNKIFSLAAGDILAMFVALQLAVLLGYQNPNLFSFYGYFSWGALTMFFFIFIAFIALDIYSLHKMPEGVLHQTLLAGSGLLLSAIVVTFIFFFLRNPVPRAVFILFYIFSWLLIGLSRYILTGLAPSPIYWKILVVGDRQPSEQMIHLIHDRKYLRSQVVGHVSCGNDTAPESGVEKLENLLPVIAREDVDQVIVTSSRLDEALNKLLLECMKRKARISDYRQVMEDLTGKVPIEYLDENWFILSLSNADRRYFWYWKRTVDITVSLAGLCLALPFLPLATILIRLDSRGPVFYSQDRIGRESKPFRLWKLRTMVDGADKNNVHWTTDNDERITRAGKFIRKTRFDEVPQLFNILKGDMSLIGPRPEAVSLVEMYAKEIPYYRERHMVTPGITGWAQINYRYGNSIEDTREKLKYDFYYIKNRSVALDLTIFLRTIRTVLTGKGAI